MKPAYLAALGGFLTLAVMACNQDTAPVQAPKVLGILELTVGNNQIGAAKFTPAKLGTQAVLNESQLVFTPSGVATFFAETNGIRQFDYVSRHFTVTNNTGNTINNLTLVALAKIGNLGGTAIKTATAFNGSTADAATAQLARPTHTMTASGIAVDTSDISRASFQALTAAEALAIQNDSNFASQGLTGTVLEYGFVATNTAGNGRGIANGSNGKVSIAMRFPKPSTATGVYNFVMTFAVTAESTNRVTRSPEELLTAAQARATALGATQTVQIDDPNVVTATSSVPVYNNLKIGTGANQTLLKSGKVVVAGVSPSNGVYTHDFAELFNAGELSVDLTNTSLQYGQRSVTAANTYLLGVGGFVPLSGVLSPGQTLLVQATLANPLAGLTALAADFSALFAATGGINSFSGGKVAFVRQNSSATALNCDAPDNPIACSTAIQDLFGYTPASVTGGNIWSEGTVFNYTLGATTEVLHRKNNGCTDTNNNSNDFEVQILSIASNPARNKSSPRYICP
jgi:hypothetical protein